MNLFRWLAAGIALGVFAASAHAQAARTPAQWCADSVPASEPSNRQFAQAEQVLQPGVDYHAILCTDSGAIYIDLLEAYTPITVNNFIFLAEQGYYNNTTFHRVIANFMAQGGDPTGTGTGGPGYAFVDEPVAFLTFARSGWLAMANAGPGTNGSQFFITTAPTPHLDYRHTIFGEVLEGADVVANIRLRDPATASEPGTSLQTVLVITDPSSVETSYVPSPVSLGAVEAVLNNFPPELLQIVSLDETITGTASTDQVAARLPEAEQSAYAAQLTANGHEYRASAKLDNPTCDLAQIPFMSISYTLDHFAEPANAALALNDALLQDLIGGEGVTAAAGEGLPNPVYTSATTACDQPAVRVVTQWQRGRFVATGEVVFPAESGIPPEIYLIRVVSSGVYERVFASVLQDELR